MGKTVRENGFLANSSLLELEIKRKKKRGGGRSHPSASSAPCGFPFFFKGKQNEANKTRCPPFAKQLSFSCAVTINLPGEYFFFFCFFLTVSDDEQVHTSVDTVV